MSEKLENIIHVPDSKWGQGKPEREVSHEVYGSLDFSFKKVPYDLDGLGDDIYDDEGNNRSGVEDIEEVDLGSISSSLGLSLNVRGVENVNNETEGAFLRFLDGGLGQRYILLRKRKPELEKLKMYIPKIHDNFRRNFLEVFVRNAEYAIEKHGDGAALFIA
ncbi:hypothetical protein EPN81_04860 [Patescibacteria group bacterium]|nr:MAG: hypothetical protein EPN81_04860 [Patescibacteria group bacterium]